MKKIPFISWVVGLSLAAVTGSFAAENGHRSLLYPISKILPDEIIPEPTRWHQPDLIPNTYFAVLVLVLFFIFATRKLKRIPEGKGQTLLELFVGSIMDFFGGILGGGSRQKVYSIRWLFLHLHSLPELSWRHSGASTTNSRFEYNACARHNRCVGRSNYRY